MWSLAERKHVLYRHLLQVGGGFWGSEGSESSHAFKAERLEGPSLYRELLGWACVSHCLDQSRPSRDAAASGATPSCSKESLTHTSSSRNFGLLWLCFLEGIGVCMRACVRVCTSTSSQENFDKHIVLPELMHIFFFFSTYMVYIHGDKSPSIFCILFIMNSHHPGPHILLRRLTTIWK